MRRVTVVAALIERGGEVLVTKRHDKGERAGLWEFPGGKVEAGEDEQIALVRELDEELGVLVEVGALFGRVEHTYPDLHVSLALYRATLAPGADPRPLQAADLQWLPRWQLKALPFCEADIPLLARLTM
jgi:8-oxo-dGTP diphosphatase